MVQKSIHIDIKKMRATCSGFFSPPRGIWTSVTLSYAVQDLYISVDGLFFASLSLPLIPAKTRLLLALAHFCQITPLLCSFLYFFVKGFTFLPSSLVTSRHFSVMWFGNVGAFCSPRGCFHLNVRLSPFNEYCCLWSLTSPWNCILNAIKKPRRKQTVETWGLLIFNLSVIYNVLSILSRL